MNPVSECSLSGGQWLGCVKIRALTGDGKTGLDLWLWVTSDAISSTGPSTSHPDLKQRR
ncbi:hypothetical protein [Rhodococcus sp. AQ5-07]|uniref:hypothetical protein n=1 Tax=Rhodococcus sp. AQ5-07 TaxID=2054902 RepID=UPI0012B53C9A|nr:hypothetical protein [Rhodococcus sp. AQ5-07]